jgi:hypothetical protein
MDYHGIIIEESLEPISKVADGVNSAGFAPISGCEAPIFPSEDRHIPRAPDFLDERSESRKSQSFREKIGLLARKWSANPAGPLSRWVLEDKSALGAVKIISTKVEPVTEEHKTPWLKQWTLHSVEISEKDADAVADALSKRLDKDHDWYADYKNDQYHFIIYCNKIFKVDLKNPILYRAAKQYGISLGIPEYQVDFAPEDKIWKR